MVRTLRKFQGFSQVRLSVSADHGAMATVMRLRDRDVATQELGDVTIAMAAAATAGAGVPPSTDGDDFVQAPPRKSKYGAGVAVSGGSR